MSRRDIVQAWFPNLKDDPAFEILNPIPGFQNATYNCFAYALDRPGERWSLNPDDKWFPGTDRMHVFTDHLDAYVGGFENAGFQCYTPRGFSEDQDSLESGIEKIALYARTNPGGYLSCSHAARQAPDGRWRSKLNTCELIEHSLVGLEDSDSDGMIDDSLKIPLGDPCGLLAPDFNGPAMRPTPQRFGKVAVLMWRRSGPGS